MQNVFAAGIQTSVAPIFPPSSILFAPAALWLAPAPLHDRQVLADSSACAASWTESSTTPPGPELMYLAAATRRGGGGPQLQHLPSKRQTLLLMSSNIINTIFTSVTIHFCKMIWKQLSGVGGGGGATASDSWQSCDWWMKLLKDHCSLFLAIARYRVVLCSYDGHVKTERSTRQCFSRCVLRPWGVFICSAPTYGREVSLLLPVWHAGIHTPTPTLHSPCLCLFHEHVAQPSEAERHSNLWQDVGIIHSFLIFGCSGLDRSLSPDLFKTSCDNTLCFLSACDTLEQQQRLLMRIDACVQYIELIDTLKRSGSKLCCHKSIRCNLKCVS